MGKTSHTCRICSKSFETSFSLNRHIKRTHNEKLKCRFCDKRYLRRTNLRIHEKRVHDLLLESTTLTCDTCSKTFRRKYNLKRHRKNHQERNNTFPCRHCDYVFPNYEQLINHVEENHPLNQHGGRRATTQPTISTENETIDKVRNVENMSSDESALRNNVNNRYIYPTGGERYDALTFFGNIRDQIRAFLLSRARRLKGIKWNLCLQVEFQRDDNQDVKVTTSYFRSRTYITLSIDDLDQHHINEALQKMFASMEKYLREGSGWYVKRVLKLEIHTIVFRPVRGSAYLSLPKAFLRSRCLLNIENSDDKCFLYCILASLYPTEMNPERPERYYDYQNRINMSGIVYPVTLSQIRKVETLNDNISVNVFTYDDECIVPLRITEKRHRLQHVNLLWLTNEDGLSHYCLITHLNRFLSRTTRHRNQRYYCWYCLHGFSGETVLTEHQQYCTTNEAQRVELPVSGTNDILQFKDYEKTMKAPFVIYCDYECIVRPLNEPAPNPQQSATVSTSKLEVCGFGYKVVCEDQRFTKPVVIYRGEDAGNKLLECLLEEQEAIEEILSNIEPMHIDEDSDRLIKNATNCCICKKKLNRSETITRHHNHLTGAIQGLACNRCNLSCKQAKFIPVIFHNLKNFDAHIICQNIGLYKEYQLNCIAQTTEKYISFSLENLRFIDSLQFLPTSLENLVDNLAQDGLRAFVHLLSETDSEEEALMLLRKGVYPYEYMDSFDRFDETTLPSKESFFSTIKQDGVSDEDYDHAHKVFRTMNMKSLGEYHDLYLKTDVVLLSDVFESFRNLCMKQYELDPCHFYTSPGLSWSACLKMTGVKLELLIDIDKVLMVELGIRGGLSQISNRYKLANNSYTPNYDSSRDNLFLQYLDANNLYGWAMIQSLPVGDFDFMNKDEMKTFDVTSISEDANIGYILEVALEYPQYLHDSHNCFPLAPELETIQNEDLSPYARNLLRKLHGLSEDDPLPKSCGVKKLLATLRDKDHYILHYRNLQLYLRLGMRLKSVYRILKFRQEPWMKSYIEHNTKMRQAAKSTFEKNFYKLLNVSVFGKTMENVRKHKNIELVHTERRLKKVTAKPTYKSARILNEDLVAVELFRNKVKLFKPIYCGMCILDLSKCLMYDFWYNYVKAKYKDKAQLQMTDTDSLLFSCQTEDLYRDMKTSIAYFDTSDYSKDHFLHNDINKKVLGKMKDETNGVPISEFVGLRSKMYSFTCNEREEKRAKGISKVTVKKNLSHECYKRTLFDETSMMSSMSSIRSYKHELLGQTIQKIGLSAYDDKRYLVDEINSYAYGHYKISDI